MKSKKGFLQFLPIALTVPFLLAAGLLLAIIFGGAAFLVWLLTRNLFVIVGGAILIISGLALLRGIRAPLMVWLIGGLLMILPWVFKGLSGLTLGMVLG